LTKLILRVLAVCLTLSLPSQSAASTIVDTGTPSGVFQWGIGTDVFTYYFAGEFTISDAYAITSIEGFFSNAHGTGGTVDIAIHADGGNIPGAILFSESKPMGAGVLIDWHGVFGSNHILAPGTYWASFTPSLGIYGRMPGVAPNSGPNPVIHYASGTDENGWLVNPDEPSYYDYLGVGVRIQGDLVPTVPDSGSTLSLFVGVALVGLAAQRFWS